MRVRFLCTSYIIFVPYRPIIELQYLAYRFVQMYFLPMYSKVQIGDDQDELAVSFEVLCVAFWR